MKENHIAYKITRENNGLVCKDLVFEEDKMRDLLVDIQASQCKGIYWVFKQLEGKPQEALCIIDCTYQRIYYHYSGEVVGVSTMIERLGSA